MSADKAPESISSCTVSFRAGGALAVTVAVGYTACTLVFVLWPETAASFMNALFHGLEFRKLQNGPALFDSGRFFYVLLVLAVEFGLLILVSLLTRPHPAPELDAFFARLHTPVGREQEVRAPAGEGAPLPQSALLGLDGEALDYRRASAFAYPAARRFGLEIPRLTRQDVAGFLLAWALVGGLILLLQWLATLGRPPAP